MKTKFYFFLIIVLCAIVCVQAVFLIKKNSLCKEKEAVTNAEPKSNFILENPVDAAFSNAFDLIPASESMRRDLRVRYKRIWKEQFEILMEMMKAKCSTDTDIEHLNQYKKHIDSSISNLQPFLVNCMLDNFGMEESPEKNSRGNSTQSALDFREGMIYRNAVLFVYKMNSTVDFELPSTEQVYNYLSDLF